MDEAISLFDQIVNSKWFKQTAMILEMQSAYVKLGTQSALFSDAFRKQEAFLRREPAAPMDCPPFMWRWAHEQKAVTSAPKDFWHEISVDAMIKNHFEHEGVAKSAAADLGDDFKGRGMPCIIMHCVPRRRCLPHQLVEEFAGGSRRSDVHRQLQSGSMQQQARHSCQTDS